jgi:hypothetical protein
MDATTPESLRTCGVFVTFGSLDDSPDGMVFQCSIVFYRDYIDLFKRLMGYSVILSLAVAKTGDYGPPPYPRLK